jgi:hypothetical protein
VIVYVYEPHACLHVMAGNGRIDKDVDNHAALRDEKRRPRKSHDQRR